MSCCCLFLLYFVFIQEHVKLLFYFSFKIGRPTLEWTWNIYFDSLQHNYSNHRKELLITIYYTSLSCSLLIWTNLAQTTDSMVMSRMKHLFQEWIFNVSFPRKPQNIDFLWYLHTMCSQYSFLPLCCNHSTPKSCHYSCLGLNIVIHILQKMRQPLLIKETKQRKKKSSNNTILWDSHLKSYRLNLAMYW